MYKKYVINCRRTRKKKESLEYYFYSNESKNGVWQIVVGSRENLVTKKNKQQTSNLERRIKYVLFPVFTYEMLSSSVTVIY